MTDLDLPPRRELTPEHKAELRARIVASMAPSRPRLLVPLSIAAVIALVALVFVVLRPNSPVDSAGDVMPQVLEPVDVSTVGADLDRCWAAAQASPKQAQFTPRANWEPRYAMQYAGHRIVAFNEGGRRAMFCDTSATAVAVSDPSTKPMDLGQIWRGGKQSVDAYGLYLSSTGTFTGVAQGTTALKFRVTGKNGTRTIPVELHSQQFMAQLDPTEGDEITTITYNDDGTVYSTATIRFDPAKVRAPGATG